VSTVSDWHFAELDAVRWSFVVLIAIITQIRAVILLQLLFPSSPLALSVISKTCWTKCILAALACNHTSAFFIFQLSSGGSSLWAVEVLVAEHGGSGGYRW
jgi:hypothetical protein